MSAIKVKVKWTNGKTTLELDLKPSEDPLTFKTQLSSVTGVPVDRQRLMYKGTVIKDDKWPDNVEEGAMFMLMGSSEKLPEAPVERPKFLEDLTETELAAAMDLPSGLVNLGNTCYMSATVQCLRVVPELREALKRFEGKLNLIASLADEPNLQGVTAALRDLYNKMDTTPSIEPVILLRMVHGAIPRFAQRGEGNTFQQQDANECWTELTRILQQYLKPIHENSRHSSFIDEYFGGVLECEMKCDEATDEPPSVAQENFLQLSCFISQDVRYLQAGLSLKMKETITKFSPSLQRDSSYTKTSRISRLPAYLTVQFVRFHYKGNVQTNAKLLRDVKFPMVLDVYELCTNELQEKLTPMRSKYKRAEDLSAMSKTEPKSIQSPESVDTAEEADDTNGEKPTASTQSPGDELMSSRAKFLANDMGELRKYMFEDDPGSNNSGYYELKAVLTHKGRSSSSGHYVGWIKREDKWFKCDDDLVELVDAEDILKLSGGGDWHCAYVCLYGPTHLELNEELEA